MSAGVNLDFRIIAEALTESSLNGPPVTLAHIVFTDQPHDIIGQ